MSLKRQAISGVTWTFVQQFSVQIINFGVQIILARLLMPEMFGLIAMLSVFIGIGQTLMDSGMTTSIIRQKNPNQLDYSTVFITNLIISCLVYIFVFLFAPFIANFYDQPILQPILRVYSLSFVFRSFVAVHIAKLTKEMNFKLQMKLQIPSTIIGAIVGVGMAYTGYGIWSLVWLNLTQAIAFTIQNWIFIKWRPSFVFNKESFIYHFSFGYKMTLSGLLDTVYKNAYNIIIGKFFSPTIVGFYNQAETMRLLPVKQITTVMGKVTYPLFSSIDNDVQLKAVYQASMKLVLFIVIPIMFTLTIIAKELFIFLFGAKWIPAVPYFQILAFASIVRPISTYNLNILKVKGRSDVFLKLEIIKKSIGIMAIAVALPYGVMALTISLTVVSYLSLFADMWYSGKFINYSMREQFKDISKLFLIGVLLLGICYVLKLNIIPYVESGFLLILLISLIYAALYLTAILIFEKDMIKIINNLIRK